MSVLVGIARRAIRASGTACAYPPSGASREAGSTRGARPPYQHNAQIIPVQHNYNGKLGENNENQLCFD